MMKPTKMKSMTMKKPTAKKSRGGKKIGRWAMKGRKKQKGGFLSLIIGALIAIGVESATAASVAAVVAPIISGVASASAGYATSKILGGSKRRLLRRRVQPRRI
jgi:hypothetical protein